MASADPYAGVLASAGAGLAGAADAEDGAGVLSPRPFSDSTSLLVPKWAAHLVHAASRRVSHLAFAL